MKRTFTLFASGLLAFTLQAQTFWTENFGTGCNRGQLASSYTGTNGAWTITNTGTNGNTANTFYVSASSAGTAVNTCASSCMTANTTNRTLHASNINIVIPNFANVGADSGATYFSGGLSSFGYTAGTDRRAESPVINCTGKSNISVSFLYLENGDAANDDATLWYYNGTTWAQIDALAKTSAACGAAGQWTSITVALPASANNNANVKIGFHWVNNDDGVGNDPSFAVDDITLSQAVTGINELAASQVNVVVVDNGIINIESAKTYKLLSVCNVLGQSVSYELDGSRVWLRSKMSGIYFVNLEVEGVKVTKKVMIQ